MCNGGKILTVSVDTSDIVSLLEMGRAFAAIADARLDVRAAATGKTTCECAGDFTADHLSRAAEAFNEVEDGARVDAGAAFAHAAAQPNPIEGAELSGTIAGPAGPGETVGTTAAPATTTPGVELDKNGMPWDQRINTANKAQTKQGVWKRAPGLTDEFYTGILAELKAVMNGAPADLAVSTGTPAAAPPPPAGTPAGTATAGPDIEEVPADFPGFLGVVSKRTMSNPPKLTPTEITIALQVVGAMNGCELHGLSDLNVRVDLIPAAYAELKKVWDAKL